MYGYGVFDFAQKLIYGRSQYSPKVYNILKQHGNEIIIGAFLTRTPIFQLITGLFKVISNLPYDKLFHLSITFITDKGNRITVEKNENINMDINKNQEGEQLYIDFPNISINEALNNTLEFMGQSKYFSYSVVNNCQNFILSILVSNNVVNGQEFVKQDTDYIFENNPKLKQLFDRVIGLYERVDVLKQGGEITKLDNGLYSDEIIDKLNNAGYSINGVFCKDQLPKLLKNGWYVVNLQNSTDGGGTHWTCLYNDDILSMYSDSYGMPCPVEIMQRTKNGMIFNNKQIQDKNSSCCGYFCIACIVFNGNNDNEYRFRKFLNMFSTNTIVNDYILKNYLESKNIY